MIDDDCNTRGSLRKTLIKTPIFVETIILADISDIPSAYTEYRNHKICVSGYFYLFWFSLDIYEPTTPDMKVLIHATMPALFSTSVH